MEQNREGFIRVDQLNQHYTLVDHLPDLVSSLLLNYIISGAIEYPFDQKGANDILLDDFTKYLNLPHIIIFQIIPQNTFFLPLRPLWQSPD